MSWSAPSPPIRKPESRVVAFLASDAASGMTGDTIHADGGLHPMG